MSDNTAKMTVQPESLTMQAIHHNPVNHPGDITSELDSIVIIPNSQQIDLIDIISNDDYALLQLQWSWFLICTR